MRKKIDQMSGDELVASILDQMRAEAADKGRGLYDKYIVKRSDGRDAPGQKHDGCEYFVLDLTHDQFAGAAMIAYATACQAEYPVLARDIHRKLAAIGFDQLVNET